MRGVAWTVAINPDGNTYASTGSTGLLRIHSAQPGTFGETLESLSPRTDGKNKFGMSLAYVRGALLTLTGSTRVNSARD